MRAPEEIEKFLRFTRMAAVKGNLIVCPAQAILDWVLGGENGDIAELLAGMENAERSMAKARFN